MNCRRVVLITAAVVMTAVGTLTGCSTDSEVVNRNISQDADNFKVPRRITFINGITDKYLLTIEGYCSLDSSNPAQLTVTCDTGQGYIRQYLGKSDNVTWVSEQLNPARVSPKFYQVTFKPESLIPDPELR